jgi:predicted nucleotidyltransferase component of viral defense system
MNLHKDKDAFIVLIEDIQAKTGYRADVIEKDYYVVMLLKELAIKQNNGLQAYFKGGTALYKALKTTNRFSEDIDISVDTRGCSRSQNDKRLSDATKKYVSLLRDSSQGRTNRSEVTSIYTYTPAIVFDENDMLQRFGKVKVEATSFTISEPIEDLEISAILYNQASEEQKSILRDTYDVIPFSIKTISLERIFIDKLFAAEAYSRKSSVGSNAFDAAKHIYDLAVLALNPRIIQLLSDTEHMRKLLEIMHLEECERLNGIPGILPAQFIFFEKAGIDPEIGKAYEIMQNQYVLRFIDRIEFEKALIELAEILSILNKNKAWLEFR